MLVENKIVSSQHVATIASEEFGTKAAYEIERIKNEEALQYYSGIVSTTDDFMSFIDRNYIFRAINQNYCSLFAKPRAEIIGYNLSELHGPETFLILKQAIDEAVSQGETSVCEFWKVYPDGTNHFIQCKYHPYYDADKEIIGVSAVARDITELKHAQNALVKSERRLQSLYDDTPSMFFTLGKDRKIKSVNAFGAEELGYQVTDLIGKTIYDLFYQDDRHQLTSVIDHCFSTLGGIQHWELRKKHKNGTTIWVKETARLVKDQSGNDQLFIVSEDISERHKLSQKLSYQASHDALTGLINRHEFERKTQKLLDTVLEDDAHHVMCYLDLDQFKIVNDSCGHLAGDTLLKNLSSLLSLKIRKGDTLARLGGGVSSFGYLKNLAVDFIKIDGSFVKDIATDPIDYAMVKSINDIAQVMDKKTIAEYVEDDDILAALHDIGVDYAQGYGIGRPCPLSDI